VDGHVKGLFDHGYSCWAMFKLGIIRAFEANQRVVCHRGIRSLAQKEEKMEKYHSIRLEDRNLM